MQYIGHIIEDCNAHARTGVSLGHYFRGLDGQDMAGIDDIGGQVLPQGEDAPLTGTMGLPRDGEFYHYMLGSLAASAAAIEPGKHGNAMCEIFGNYGWAEGVQLEKYLADHFMVCAVSIILCPTHLIRRRFRILTVRRIFMRTDIIPSIAISAR